MKKILAISLAALMMLCVIGCDKKDDSSLIDGDSNADNEIISSTVKHEGYEFGYAVNEHGDYEITSVEYTGTASIDIKIPSEVDGRAITGIGADAFKADTFIKSVVIPSSITYIDDFAFYGCSGLTSVTLPDSITDIGAGAFWDCTSLKSIKLSENLVNIGNYAFMNCTSLETLTLTAKVETIGDGAFFSCEKLQTVTLPESVKTVGKGAFIYCEALKSVNIESKEIKLAEEGVFIACHKDLVINYPSAK